MAHRGGYIGDDDGIENTVHAFQRAVDLGYYHLETDIHLTTDGVVVAFHDPDLARMVGSPAKIQDLAWPEVRAMTIGGHRIPTLDELLEQFPDRYFNIDMKTEATVEPLVRILQRHQAHHRVCIASFNQLRLRRFRKLTGGKVATSAGPVGIAWSALVSRLASRINEPAQAYQVPTRYQIGRLRVPVLNAGLRCTAAERGIPVQVWTVNDATEMKTLIEAGVSGLISDRIDVLKNVAIECDVGPHN